MKKLFLVGLLILSTIYAKEYVPWYTGPLVAPAAHNRLPGTYSVQPYFNVYQYSDHLLKIYPTCTLKTGITKWLDIQLNLEAYYNQKHGKKDIKYGDTAIGFGFQLYRATLKEKMPTIRLIIQENFPSGKYQKFNPDKHGVDKGGSGSYNTSFCIVAEKVFFFIPSHPLNTYLTLFYDFPAKVHVHGFNTYGGGYGTNGRVSPGNLFQGMFSFEFSITQVWVYAMDIIFNHSGKTTFSGENGITQTGAIATNTSPSSHFLELTPSIEYNITANLGIIAGLDIPVFRKNTTNYIAGMISLFYLW